MGNETGKYAFFCKSEKLPGCVLFLLLLPLVLIGINSMHDWGDDHAQYISQAKELVENTPATVKVLDNENIGPPFRGAGFSLLLAPVYMLFGNSTKAFVIFLSIILFFTGLIVSKFFKANGIPAWLAVLLVLIFVYNYHVLRLKTSVIPVFPFMLVLYACLLLNQVDRLFILQCLLVGFLISIASSGWVFYLAWVGIGLFVEIKSWGKKSPATLFCRFLIPIAVYVLIKLVVFKNIATHDLSWYKDVFSFRPIVKNASYYIHAYKTFFEQEVPNWMNFILKFSTFVFFLIGLFKKIITRIGLPDVFFIVYLFMLLCYPYNATGMRFLVPVIPVMLLYVFKGLDYAFEFFKARRFYIAGGILLMVLLSNFINLKTIIITNPDIHAGPESVEANHAFEQVKNVTSEEDVVAFPKPYALYLYTNRRGICIHPEMKVEMFEANLLKYKAHYVLIGTEDNTHNEMKNEKILNTLRTDSWYKEVWRNKEFVLFRAL